MKLGYSMLLGEFVDSKDVTYADTTAFQICCPECRDALFKVERLGSKDVIEYFSHFRQSKEISDVCELRVKSIGQQEREAKNAESRGQTLQAFRRVLREAVLLDRQPSMSREDVLRFHDEASRGTNLRTYLEFMAEVFFLDGFLIDNFDHFLNGFQSRLIDGVEMETSFARSIQRRIALDLVKHLCSPHAAKTRDFLIVHALHSAMINVQHARETDTRAGLQPDQPTLEAERAISTILNGTRQSYAILGSGVKENGFGSFNEHVIELLLGTLVRLPYLEMLTNHRAGRDMLDGIHPPEDGFIGFKPSSLRHLEERAAPRGM